VISPCLSNIFLHHVLDEWFENEVKPRLKGKSTLARFADDGAPRRREEEVTLRDEGGPLGPERLEDLASFTNPVVRGWLNYYGRFYRSKCIQVLRHFNEALGQWARWKFKRFKRRERASMHWLDASREGTPSCLSCGNKACDRRLAGKSRMTRERPVRICEGGEVRLLSATRPVMAFADFQDAKRVLDVLGKRLARYELTLHPDKTRFVDFRSYRPSGKDHSDTDGTTFTFLGFCHVWGKSRKGKNVVRQVTAKKRYARALAAVVDWCRTHRHQSFPEQHAGCKDARPLCLLRHIGSIFEPRLPYAGQLTRT
jgi:hypothetical protein